MPAVKDLIARASDLCQGDARLARRIGKSPTQIADMRSGRLAITPETVALLCDVLQLSGEECRELAAQAVCENPKNAAIVRNHRATPAAQQPSRQSLRLVARRPLCLRLQPPLRPSHAGRIIPF